MRRKSAPRPTAPRPVARFREGVSQKTSPSIPRIHQGERLGTTERTQAGSLSSQERPDCEKDERPRRRPRYSIHCGSPGGSSLRKSWRAHIDRLRVLSVEGELGLVLRIVPARIGPDLDFWIPGDDFVQERFQERFVHPGIDGAAHEGCPRVLQMRAQDGELSLKNFGNSGKHEHVLDGDEGPRVALGDQLPRTLRHVCEREVVLVDLLAVVAADEGFELGVANHGNAESEGDGGDGHIVVRDTDAATREDVVEVRSMGPHFTRDALEVVGDGDDA